MRVIGAVAQMARIGDSCLRVVAFLYPPLKLRDYASSREATPRWKFSRAIACLSAMDEQQVSPLSRVKISSHYYIFDLTWEASTYCNISDVLLG